MFATVFLLLVVVLYRVLSGFWGSADYGWLHNVAPVAAVALCGAVYLPRRVAIVLPLAMLAVSDVILNVYVYHWPLLSFHIIPRYAALGLISAIGFALRERNRAVEILGASIVGSLLFYVLTNTGSWIADPAYGKTFAGWLQALTSGVPGYPPTWWFYRHTLMGDVLFTLVFLGCMKLQTSPQPAPQPRRREQLVPW